MCVTCGLHSYVRSLMLEMLAKVGTSNKAGSNLIAARTLRNADAYWHSHHIGALRP